MNNNKIIYYVGLVALFTLSFCYGYIKPKVLDD